MQDALALLGLRAGGFDLEALRQAFRRAALRLHPDRGGTDAAYGELKAAYARLKKFLAENGPAPPVHSELRAAALAAAAQCEAPVQREFNRVEFNRAFEREHLDRPEGHGEWLAAEVPQDLVCPEKVSFRHFNAKFSEMAKRNSLSLIVRTQLVMPAAGCTLAPGRMGGDEVADDYSSGVGSRVPYSDLRIAHAQQIIDSDEAAEFARAKAAELIERLSEDAAEPAHATPTAATPPAAKKPRARAPRKRAQRSH